MASNYSRKSGSSGSRRTASPRRSEGGRPYAARPSSGYVPSGHGHNSSASRRRPQQPDPRLRSVTVRDIERATRQKRARQTYRRRLVSLGVAAALVVVLVGAGVFLYHSSVFQIESVSFNGAEHLTNEEMVALADIDEGATLLNIDVSALRENLLEDAWIEEVAVHRVFPDSLEVDVTERTVAAVVEVPTSDGADTKDWAIASDGMWLMPIPKKGTEEAERTSERVYEDAAGALHITEVPYGTQPKVGERCDDANVNNALSIVDGLTTELADRVTSVKATETESTTLTIKDGPDIVFGTDEHVREKERVCLQIMEDHPEGVAYINVRTVDRPTWRAL
ncbi:cell division protein FtsQ/DivIB [Xiamenia xianingshaonis]|uniref:FtsQ-type POTRA domain-containing protein n=1 Tax=Xiamenia xianingshaonis TaxID=2682776 RepID=A0A9E6MRP9_9ACTN|nr:FtsQ-type POTRA domain-containing protein [Xiamenia xianingshaonis]NHM14831.1 FtsQ-type POTRA domain-containing protein [Xiamenia xianingshaonis]QTU84762.1 FtsQ-type POTRA domain-containing protein [Xiamenia xianingshaonis]